jgi:hypothetical protein
VPAPIGRAGDQLLENGVIVDEPSTGRRFIGAWRPSKPVSEMTDEDWEVFARSVYEQVVARVKESESTSDDRGSGT